MVKYDNCHGHMVPNLEDTPTNIGGYVFTRHKGDLSVQTLEDYENNTCCSELTYHPVDYFNDLIDALNYFKDEGLHIRLEAKDFAKLVEDATWESPMGYEDEGVFTNHYVPFNRYDFIKGYGKFRRDVLEKDHHKCMKCGKEEDLQVHHIASFKNNLEFATSVWNGATLCKDCHKEYHKRYGWNANQERFFKYITRG